jgi:hypothetical protein
LRLSAADADRSSSVLISGIDLDLDPDTVWSQSTCTALVAVVNP